MPKTRNKAQDIDAGSAGSAQRAAGRDEPHRAHDVKDRGPGSACEEQHGKRAQQARYARETIEHALPPPSEPDDPASS